MAKAVDPISPAQSLRERGRAAIARGAVAVEHRLDARRAAAVLAPSSAARPAITTAYGCDPADATQRAVNDETFSS